METRFGSRRLIVFVNSLISSLRTMEQRANGIPPHGDGGLGAPPFAFPFRGKAPQWGLVFTLMTLELGLIPLPLYARNR